MSELDARYRARMAELQRRIVAALGRLYEDVDADDIDAAFERLVPQAERLLRAGQSAAVSLVSAYMSALVTLSEGRRADFSTAPGLDIIGSTAAGATLAEGMAAWPAMVKARIGAGAAIREALDYGRYLVERFGDAEVTAAADRQTEAITTRTKEFAGWFGTIVGATCDECQSNAGFHTLDQPMFRHGGCDCIRQYVVAT